MTENTSTECTIEGLSAYGKYGLGMVVKTIGLNSVHCFDPECFFVEDFECFRVF